MHREMKGLFIVVVLVLLVCGLIECNNNEQNLLFLKKFNRKSYSKYLLSNPAISLDESARENVEVLTTSGSAKLWVFFNKKVSSEAEKSRLLSEVKLSEETKNRRLVRSGKSLENLVDEGDLPVNEDFIQMIKEECSNDQILIHPHKTSKWLNSVSISLKTPSKMLEEDQESLIQQTLSCISDFDFVESIDLVSKYVKDFGENEVESEKTNKMEDISDLFVENPIRTSRKIQENSYDQSFYGGTYGGVKQIFVPELQSKGYDGSGITILMIDSGYYTSHEAFASMNIVDTYDFINNQVNVTGPLGNEQNKHGTATLSTIGGYVQGTLIGPAYNANYLLAKTEVVDSENIIEEDYWIHALEWGEAKGAELVSSSLGYNKWYTYPLLDGEHGQISKAADAAASKGMVVVISAGNNGNDGIGAPADGKNVIAVGALDLTGKNTYFSSVGPSADGRVKPDISTLGSQNFVANHIGVNNYTKMSGTSFACPLAAGAIALLMQAKPTWTREQIVDAITQTASKASSPNIHLGYGILNIAEAFKYTQRLPASPSECSSFGCSGHGGCCGSTCTCAPDRYGDYCQYSRIGCSYECSARNGKCQMDPFGYYYRCVGLNDQDASDFNPRSQCANCDSSWDRCGVCGGNGTICLGCDGIPYSGKMVDLCGVCGGDGDCKAIVLPKDDNVNNLDESSNLEKLKLYLSVGIGSLAGIGLIAFGIIFYRKRRVLSLSSDGSLPVLKGYTPLDNIDSAFSIDYENDEEIHL